MNNFLTILLSAGGAAFLTAVIAGLRNLSTTRLESEAALIQRLNDDAEKSRSEADKQRARAERAERYNETLREDKEDALDKAARYRRLLIENGIKVEDTDE